MIVNQLLDWMAEGWGKSRNSTVENVDAPSQAVLILCHEAHSSIVSERERISRDLESEGNCMLLFHQCSGEVRCLKLGPSYVFTDESLGRLPYNWLFQNKVVPGSTHFPLLEFFSKFPQYEFYWVIEGDVKFSGCWKRFFKAFEGNGADFVTCYLRRHEEDPGWYWWPTLSHPVKKIPLDERVASFNPIYRISRRALQYLHECHCAGWSGHFEVLIATLLFHGGFQLQDIGGLGKFAGLGAKKRFYTRKTMRHAPPFRGIGWARNKLYHPVKCVSEKSANVSRSRDVKTAA